jgi:NAD(P)-dependent dehydrogenase (short-subunit alcohol dehydrogenase family)
VCDWGNEGAKSGIEHYGADPMDLNLAGKVVLITGSSRGIGLATAKAFAAEGCRLMLSARSAGPLAEAEAALREHGGRGRSRSRRQQA